MGLFSGLGDIFGGVFGGPVGLGVGAGAGGLLDSLFGGGGGGGNSGGGGGGGGGANWPMLMAFLSSPLGSSLFGGGRYHAPPGIQQQTGVANQLAGAGGNFMAQAQAGLPQLSNMGALGNIGNVTGEMSRLTGVADPFTGQGGMADPFALNPAQQEGYNTTAGQINTGRESDLEALRQRFAASGIDDPRAMAAAEAQIHAGHNEQLASAHAGMANQAYQTRVGTEQNFESLLPQLFGLQLGQQMGYGNLGESMLGGAGRFYGQAGQLQQQDVNTQRQSLGALLGLMFGRGGGGGGMNPNNMWGGGNTLTGSTDMGPLTSDTLGNAANTGNDVGTWGNFGNDWSDFGSLLPGGF